MCMNFGEKIDPRVLFMEDDPAAPRGIKRSYDVKVSLNECGRSQAKVVRFGLLNAAAAEARKHAYIEVTNNPEVLKSRIYFRFHEERANSNSHKISNSGAEDGGRYFSITPSSKTERFYRTNWVGKTYKLQYDAINELYYIDNTKED